MNYTLHAREKMRSDMRGIRKEEVREAAKDCALVETQGHKAVVVGLAAGRPLHLVCDYSEEADRLDVLTVYEPDLIRWRRAYQHRNLLLFLGLWRR